MTNVGTSSKINKTKFCDFLIPLNLYLSDRKVKKSL